MEEAVSVNRCCFFRFYTNYIDDSTFLVGFIVFLEHGHNLDTFGVYSYIYRVRHRLC